MSVFLQHIKTAWNDYFPQTSLNHLNSETFTSKQSPSGTGVYVSNCLFRSIWLSSGNGGALYCSSSITYFLVESSSFFSCKTTSGYGGAIYFENSGGQSVLYEVCGYDCCSTHSNPYCQFAYLIVNNAASYINYFNYSSISHCVNEASNSNYILRLCYGKICCPSVNMSMNKCQYYSSITCNTFVDSSLVSCSISFSTFTDNTANGYSCIILWTTGAKYEIKSCNILRNKQGTLGTYGTIYTTGNLMIEGSCILENTANRNFHQGDSSYRITISNCTVDSTSNNGFLTIPNTVTKSFILGLKHISTENCHSEYDSVGYLTPIIQSPSSSKKQIYYTCKRLYYLFPRGNFFSLISLFILNLIHPYSFI
jgi:hypothetical protein